MKYALLVFLLMGCFKATTTPLVFNSQEEKELWKKNHPGVKVITERDNILEVEFKGK